MQSAKFDPIVRPDSLTKDAANAKGLLTAINNIMQWTIDSADLARIDKFVRTPRISEHNAKFAARIMAYNYGYKYKYNPDKKWELDYPGTVSPQDMEALIERIKCECKN